MIKSVGLWMEVIISREETGIPTIYSLNFKPYKLTYILFLVFRV
jgi:hypothetical protein